jgi:hypothetical protein
MSDGKIIKSPILASLSAQIVYLIFLKVLESYVQHRDYSFLFFRSLTNVCGTSIN